MEIETILSILAFVGSIVSGAFAVYTYRKSVVHDKKQATLEAYNRLEAEALEPLDKLMPAKIKDIAHNPRSEEYKQITSYVARIEHFCIGVEEKIYDFDVVYKLGHGFLECRILNRIEPIIAKKNSSSDEDYYANTNAVIGRMQLRNSKRRNKKTVSRKREFS